MTEYISKKMFSSIMQNIFARGKKYLPETLGREYRESKDQISDGFLFNGQMHNICSELP